MSRSVSRSLIAWALVGLGAAAGCGSSAPKNVVSCQMSLAAYCAQYTCFATWAEAEAAASTCQSDSLQYTTLSCGAYLALNRFFGDGSDTAYYDAATGQLVVAGGYSANTGLYYCEGGPAAGFTFPTCDEPDAAAPLDCGAPDHGIAM
jgi:hypothetical protein